MSPCLLPDRPQISSTLRRNVAADYDRFAHEGLPADLEQYLLTEYELDVTARYAGRTVRNPWGKASGQLSMNAGQVAEDVAAGLGFVVLKTAIAQDALGERSMAAWAVPAAKMLTERITGRSGKAGWTVTWKGRGWWQSFEEYLELIQDARRVAGDRTLIVPSCKYHLPQPGEDQWRTGEYAHTTGRLLQAWKRDAHDTARSDPMPIEKDFSPTLAGSDLASQQSTILNWLRTVPRLIRHAAGGRDRVSIGLKVFNARFDDDFQVQMLNAIHHGERPDYFVYGNRLFDPDREFQGHRGVAFGGPDLSDRNLSVMTAFQNRAAMGDVPLPALDWSATGNIATGRMAVEYALRGATSFQLHTYFQLPADAYLMKHGSRTARALHELYFHPDEGFVVWMMHLAATRGVAERPVRFLDERLWQRPG